MSSPDRRNTPAAEITTPSTVASEQILSALPDLIFEFTPDGHYAAMHAGSEDELYCPPEDFLSLHYSEVLPDDVAEKFGAAFHEATDSGEPTTVSYLLPASDELDYYECRFLPLEDGPILATIRNMTDTWRTKTELEQSESRYRTLVNNIPGMVYRCLTDKDWTAVFVSPAVEDLTGYPASDFMSRRRNLADITHPEDRQPVRRQVMAALEQRRPFHVSYRMIGADGEIRHVAERGQAVYAKHDEVDYLDGVVFDVTDIHRMRQRVLLNSKMAAVGNLAAGVAHEINNPLTIAMANLEFVSRALDNGADGPPENADEEAEETVSRDDIQAAIDKVHSSIERVQSIIDDLRTFTDAADSRADQIDLQRLTEWAIRRTRAQSSTPGRIESDIDSVPNVWASEVGVVQVIWNLVDNGLEAIADDDSGAVHVSLREIDDRVVLQICDDGPGMDADVATRAFEPFFTTKPVGEGAGLGLFVCKGLVEGMDGSIELDTAPGDGTCVRISFPAFSAPYPDASTGS